MNDNQAPIIGKESSPSSTYSLLCPPKIDVLLFSYQEPPNLKQLKPGQIFENERKYLTETSDVLARAALLSAEIITNQYCPRVAVNLLKLNKKVPKIFHRKGRQKPLR